ncbi:hypothetical protein [Paenibacillus kandeliae]|uniref:hypothetical protein n=1 Tax=Paenibacillus kandeliae TaxID=3231269 RepID=UPI003458A06B
MAQREVHISVINVTDSELVLENKTVLAHGEWVVSPTHVPNNAKPANFEADSDGFSAQSSSPAYNIQVIGGSGNMCNVTYLVSNT